MFCATIWHIVGQIYISKSVTYYRTLWHKYESVKMPKRVDTQECVLNSVIEANVAMKHMATTSIPHITNTQTSTVQKKQVHQVKQVLFTISTVMLRISARALINFWDSRMGAYSRVGAYFKSQFSQKVQNTFQTK